MVASGFDNSGTAGNPVARERCQALTSDLLCLARDPGWPVPSADPERPAFRWGSPGTSTLDCSNREPH